MKFVRDHGPGLESDKKFVLETGKDLTEEDITREGAVLIGNCAGQCAKGFGKSYCAGCPPVGSSILAFIRGEETGEETERTF